MVVILVVVRAFAGFEEEVASDHLEDSASEAPDVSRGVVISANNDLWRPVLACLDLGSEVVVGPAAVTHVANLHLHVLINLWASTSDSLFLLLLLLLLLLSQIILHQQPIEVEGFLSVEEINAALLHVLFLLLLGALVVNLIGDVVHHSALLLLVFEVLGPFFLLSIFLLDLLLALSLQLLPHVLLLLSSQPVHSSLLGFNS